MSSLRDLRRKLHSVESTKKITDAMERIAAVQLRRVQAKVAQTSPYISKIAQVLEKLDATDSVNPLFEQRIVKKTGLVIVSADKGLAGSYNSNILLAADNFLKKYHDNAIELVLIGNKAIDHYQRKNWKIRQQILARGEKITFLEVKTLSEQLIRLFVTKELDEIWLIYTHHISMLRRRVVVEKFLNIEKPRASKKKEYVNAILEPNAEKIFSEILPRYCTSRIQMALNEAHTSELAARIVAMQAASKNSEEMIKRLTLVKNKVRQADITREMIEISSGAEGLK